MTTCSICGAKVVEHAHAAFRGKYPAAILKCTECGFMFVPNPTWLAEAYAEPINRSDTGYVWRNLWARDRVTHLIESFLNADGVFLDYAAGYGLFVRLMRDAGYDFRWSDLYCQNLFARGFEAPLTGTFEAVTAFEVFEHLINPREEMEKLAPITSCVIFSTMLVPEPAPALADWWYYGIEHGQHIAWYTRKSLEILGGQFDCRLVTDGVGLHIFSRKPISPTVLASPRASRWQRFLNRLKPKKSRPSLTMSDHDFIEKGLRENQGLGRSS